MQEVWKDITSYEGLYQVSNLGRVKSLERFKKKEQILKLSDDGRGYWKVQLCKNGVMTNKRLHRLIAEAFLPNPDNLPCINHKDENKKNNSLENLEWCTKQYNNQYSLCKPVICLETGIIYKSLTHACEELGISSASNIIRAIKTKCRANGYHWDYYKEGDH